MNCDVKNSEILSILFFTLRTRVDIKQDSQHGSFSRKMIQAMSIKSWNLVGKV